MLLPLLLYPVPVAVPVTAYAHPAAALLWMALSAWWWQPPPSMSVPAAPAEPAGNVALTAAPAAFVAGLSDVSLLPLLQLPPEFCACLPVCHLCIISAAVVAV